VVDHISPYDHQDHSSPPPSVFEVAVALASSLIVFLVRFEQSMLLQYEGCADKETGAYGKDNTNCFVYRRPVGATLACIGASSIGGVCTSIQAVGCDKDMTGGVHVVLEVQRNQKSMVCCDDGTPYLWCCSRSIKRLVVRRIGMFVWCL
jgi:hypothetical protein